jgi:endonuclease G
MAGPAIDAVRSGTPEKLTEPADISTGFALEAIVLADLRPAYLIQNDRIQIDGNYEHMDELRAHIDQMETICQSVGRVDLFNHRAAFVGTGWLIEDDVVVTNRHVAQIFSQTDHWDEWDFISGSFGRPVVVQVNPYHQHLTVEPELSPSLQVTGILYVATANEPDIALLRVDRNHRFTPVELQTGQVQRETPIAAVGYPAADPGRNDPQLMSSLFADVYEVKRFSPGLCTGYAMNDSLLLSDCTTLGGSSGSAVLDIQTGRAVALHFAGEFKEANFAVPADLVAAALRNTRTVIVMPGSDSFTEATPAVQFDKRSGYDYDFLGAGHLQAALPGLGARASDVAPVTGTVDNVLRYTHFSIVQSRSRRLPMLTAVNIDGSQEFRLKRKGTWKFDGRLSAEHQAGKEQYSHKSLDRGHMVRRMDPGWGLHREEAQQAEIDTFHYTNSVPQHKDLNRKDWVGLEDYILESALTQDFKLCVMTGPVFLDSDRTLRNQHGANSIRIPEHFWKVAVMINADSGELSVTGYLLTQGELIRHLTEASFVLGNYQTYQVKLSRIAELTGFDFGHLESHDPLRIEPEGIFGRSATLVTGPESLRL